MPARMGVWKCAEILELKLNAELVTLSACDTALGSGYFAEVPAGDDLVGLTRRVHVCRAALRCWPACGKSTTARRVQLMRSFYGHLRDSDKGDRAGAGPA